MKTKKKNATKPIDWKDAKKAMLYLESEKEYHSLLILAAGFYTGYRISDILKLKYLDFSQDFLDITEKKTSKQRSVQVIPELRRVVSLCQKELKKKDDHFLFTSMRYISNNPIHVATGIERVKSALTKAGVKANKLTGHVLRKTFALRYFLLAQKKGLGEERALIELSDMLNHASTKVTRDYIGLSERLKADIFADFA